MAFNANPVAFPGAQQSNGRQQKTVLGYVNMYLPKASGGRAKFGAVALHAEVPNEKALFNMLNDEKVSPEQLSAAVTFEFNAVSREATLDMDAFKLPESKRANGK